MTTPDDDAETTRRSVLGTAAGLAAGAVVPTTVTATGGDTVTAPTVLTQNAYVGVDLSRLFEAESGDEVRRIVGDFLAAADADVYGARADAMAEEMVTAGADVVALQEAGVVRTQRPSDFGEDSSEPASNVLVDLLDSIQSSLADRGQEYDVAASVVTTDVELPADTDDGPVDVRLTDRDALLVRSDLTTRNPVEETYSASLGIPSPNGGGVGLFRGYCLADVVLDGVTFTAASTHLESVSAIVRRLQAREFLRSLPETGPVIVGGDFNSGPGESAYERLTETLADPYPALHPDSKGYTCCQAADLRNETSRLDRRIDALLYRGAVRPTAIGRVGHRPEDRVAIERDSETVRLWPSDHAGVVGTFEVEAATPTSTPTPTPNPTATPTPTPVATTDEPTPRSPDTPTTPPTGSATRGGAGPGFDVGTTLASLCALFAWARQR